MRLEIEDLRATYDTVQGPFHALDGISLTMGSGRTLGLVGESGSGKSSLARAIVGLTAVTGGRILADGQDVTAARRRADPRFRRQVQMVFQNPYASLNPRMRVGAALAEALSLHRPQGRKALRKGVADLLEQVQLPADAAGRFPRDFSGGQRQRIAIARALAVQPQLLIADEITSALDVSVQAAILDLLRDLQARQGIGLLFISHNLNVVRQLADDVAVLHLGKIVEHGPVAQVFSAPQHPYTRVLLESVPVLGRPAEPARDLGPAPDPAAPPPGCRFHTRCPVGPRHLSDRAICAAAAPDAIAPSRANQAACHFAAAASR